MSGPVLDSPWHTVGETATYARSSKTEVLAALADGSLRGSQLRPNGRWRVHRDDIDAWLRGEEPPARTERFTRSRRSA